MSRTNVNPDYKWANSDVLELTEVDTNRSLAMITTDSAGNFNWKGITRAPLDRNAMQTTTSSNKYSDLDKPWMSIPQEDWSGGRAAKWFTDDQSKFYDSKRAQTGFKGVFLGPLDYYSTGYRDSMTNHPGSVSWQALRGDTAYIAVAITPGENLDTGEIYIHLRRRGTPTEPLTVSLTEGLSQESTVIATHDFTTDEVTDTVSEFYKFTFDSYTLLMANTYYIWVYSEDGDQTDYWEVGINTTSQTTTHQSSDGIAWSTSAFELYYRVADAQDDSRVKFFDYEQLMFMVRQEPNQDSPHLWMNGDICVATAATSTTITDNTKLWTINAFAGARIGLVYRNGSEGHVSVWRTIASNTADTITVDEDWDITPSAGCVFIIYDTPLWQEITGHGLTKDVTDIHVVRNVVYFCQGDYTNVIKMRWNSGSFEFMTLNFAASFLQSVRDTNALMLYRALNDDDNHKRSVERAVLPDWETANAVAETDPFTPEGTTLATVTSAVTTSGGSVVTTAVDFNSGDYDSRQYIIDISTFSSTKNTGKIVITLQESEDNSAFEDVQSVTATGTGRWYINAHCQYRYRRLLLTASGTDCSVNNITAVTSQMPRWVDRVTLLDGYGKITGLFEYGADSTKSLWIFQEGMVSSINKMDNTVDTYTHDRINIDELRTTAEEWNGSTTDTSDVYMIWSWLNGLQRYYNTQLEGKGPDKDEGLPTERQGRISRILSYPSNFFAAVDGGENGISSVLMYNQNGWHEIYRAPNTGERILDMYFQPIYGSRPDRLWLQVGADVVWLAMPSKTLNALHDPNAEYTHEAVVVSAWMTGGMTDVQKLWESMKIIADDLAEDGQYVEADYQVDDEDEWHPVENFYTESPSQKEVLSNTRSVNGKKFRYRLRIQSNDMYKTPHINVVVIEALGRVDIKYSYAFTARNIKWKRDLNAEYEEVEPMDVQEILDEWANNLTKLRLNCRYKVLDNKTVYLDATQTSVLTELQEGYLVSITVNEI